MIPFDVLTMGRVGVDLYPEQSGVPLADSRLLCKVAGRNGHQRAPLVRRATATGRR